MPLERRYHTPCLLVILAGRKEPIAVLSELRLKVADLRSLIAHRERDAVCDRFRRDPGADPGSREPAPGKFFARILLAHGRHVRMGEHAPGWDRVSRHNIAAEGDHRCDLRVGKVIVTPAMS